MRICEAIVGKCIPISIFGEILKESYEENLEKFLKIMTYNVHICLKWFKMSQKSMEWDLYDEQHTRYHLLHEV